MMGSKKCVEGILARLLVISGKRQEVNSDEVVASLAEEEKREALVKWRGTFLLAFSLTVGARGALGLASARRVRSCDAVGM